VKKTLVGYDKRKYFENPDGYGDDLLKFDGNPKNESFGIPPPTITVPHDLQQRSVDLGVYGESKDESGVDNSADKMRSQVG